MIIILKSVFVRLGIPFHALISQMDLNFMNRLFKFHIACDMIAQEVHDLGQTEVKRIRSRMERIIKEMGFECSFKEFLEMRFFYDIKEELLNGYKGLCEKIIKSKMKDSF